MPNASCATTNAPELAPELDFGCYTTEDASGETTLFLQIEGMRCAACAWRIEAALNGEPGVQARVNYSTQRVRVAWPGEAARANALAATVQALGFRVAPFDSAQQQSTEAREQRFLLRCLAVAGFASGNIMLFSLALWFSSDGSMGEATRTMMHWFMALIAMPTVIYAGRPFYASAWEALRHGRTNMDVPIALAISLATLMSLYETVRHGPYVYFDSSVMLLFFLLIGRYLDKRARGRVRAAASGLLAMLEGTATVLQPDGSQQHFRIRDLQPGMRLQVAMGERIAADGVVVQGTSEVDTSLVTGETVPRLVEPNARVFAGMVNVGAPLVVEISAASDASLLADIVQMMERAEQAQAGYVRIADRVAQFYTPAVHALAAVTFIGWWWLGDAPWQAALLYATAVLIITCPCALGLAVPAVQVLASGQLFRRGMLLKSGNALEKLASVDVVILDKTGTLTHGQPALLSIDNTEALPLAASLASHSRHPLVQALVRAYGEGELLALEAVEEVAGQGVAALWNGQRVQLGRRSWCGDASAPNDAHMELWLRLDGHPPVRCVFEDALRADAAATVAQLQQLGLEVQLMSGDRAPVAASVATAVGIAVWHAECTPVTKADAVAALTAQGRKVLMVGDGLNDAPALAAAHVSMSPSTALDITQNAADLVFQGALLAPVAQAVVLARAAMRLVKQNFVLSLGYNVLAVPLAVCGYATPLVAAIAMSSSSLLVILNAMRLGRGRA